MEHTNDEQKNKRLKFKENNSLGVFNHGDRLPMKDMKRT